MLGRAASWTAILLLPLSTGCTAGGNYTIVEGRLKPSHFKFATIVEQLDARPGGWRAACLHLRLSHDTGAAVICTVGVEVPIQTGTKGPISLARAQRVAASCANLAADIAFGPTTRETPAGTRVNTYCLEGTTPFPEP